MPALGAMSLMSTVRAVVAALKLVKAWASHVPGPAALSHTVVQDSPRLPWTQTRGGLVGIDVGMSVGSAMTGGSVGAAVTGAGDGTGVGTGEGTGVGSGEGTGVGFPVGYGVGR